MPKALVTRAAVAIIAATVALPCAAQDYPTRPVTLVVAFAPGGAAIRRDGGHARVGVSGQRGAPRARVRRIAGWAAAGVY